MRRPAPLPTANAHILRALELLALVLLTSGVLLCGFYTSQDDFAFVFTGFTLAFAGYALAIHLSVIGYAWHTFFILALVLRVVLLFSFPGLSDDVFRFLWDGRLMHLGIHPLRYIPDQLVSTPAFASGMMQELYRGLNSPHYYSVYPPLAQEVFYCSTFDALGGIREMVWGMKFFWLLGEGATIWGLYIAMQRFGLARWKLLLYLLNPLVLVEIMGNMHMEGIMVAFLLWSGLALSRRHWVWSGVLYALAVGTKLLPLMFLPLVLIYLKSWRSIGRFLLGSMVTWIVLFVPFLWGDGWAHLLNSLQLYYARFEFNAGLYYLLRALGTYVMGYNPIHYIGPAMAASALGVILLITLRAQRRIPMSYLPVYALLIYLAYALFSLTLHPWYLILPLFLTVFVPNSIVPVWTYLITLTYINYSFEPYREVLGVVFAEYAVVFLLFVWEYKTTRWIRKGLGLTGG